MYNAHTKDWKIKSVLCRHTTTELLKQHNPNLCCSKRSEACSFAARGESGNWVLMTIALMIAVIILQLFLLTAESPRFVLLLPLLAWWRFILIWMDHQLDKERSAQRHLRGTHKLTTWFKKDTTKEVVPGQRGDLCGPQVLLTFWPAWFLYCQRQLRLVKNAMKDDKEDFKPHRQPLDSSQKALLTEEMHWLYNKLFSESAVLTSPLNSACFQSYRLTYCSKKKKSHLNYFIFTKMEHS